MSSTQKSELEIKTFVDYQMDIQNFVKNYIDNYQKQKFFKINVCGI
jgi:hypothetical protein